MEVLEAAGTSSGMKGSLLLELSWSGLLGWSRGLLEQPSRDEGEDVAVLLLLATPAPREDDEDDDDAAATEKMDGFWGSADTEDEAAGSRKLLLSVLLLLLPTNTCCCCCCCSCLVGATLRAGRTYCDKLLCTPT